MIIMIIKERGTFLWGDFHFNGGCGVNHDMMQNHDADISWQIW